MIPVKEELIRYVSFKTSRSGGKGGQNVNKVSSKVELICNPDELSFFSDEQKALLKVRLGNRLDQEGNLHIVSQEDRSQLVNKQRTLVKLEELLKLSLHVAKARKPTKIPKGVVRKRLTDKLFVATRKQSRRRPDID
ncbi:peptide chain release factor-like protein [Pedobacter duraquae]|uniref:Ribosome-associated protein n=1 Tax=Pedobacter duraquae TaxID=425511 RepID=A0A4R6IRB0_9SPHI|nr:peptide chain release factor-like protein [Pedobacter duraquae]TDO24964.1 ribosome-associated protein [Pedobacter duraquae]